jgi:hypothetical protein
MMSRMPRAQQPAWPHAASLHRIRTATPKAAPWRDVFRDHQQKITLGSGCAHGSSTHRELGSACHMCFTHHRGEPASRLETPAFAGIFAWPRVGRPGTRLAQASSMPLQIQPLVLAASLLLAGLFSSECQAAALPTRDGSLLVGWQLRPGFALGVGGLWLLYSPNPRPTENGQPYGQVDVKQPWLEGVDILGPFVDIYPSPRLGWHVQALVGYAQAPPTLPPIRSTTG